MTNPRWVANALGQGRDEVSFAAKPPNESVIAESASRLGIWPSAMTLEQLGMATGKGTTQHVAGKNQAPAK